MGNSQGIKQNYLDEKQKLDQGEKSVEQQTVYQKRGADKRSFSSPNYLNNSQINLSNRSFEIQQNLQQLNNLSRKRSQTPQQNILNPLYSFQGFSPQKLSIQQKQDLIFQKNSISPQRLISNTVPQGIRLVNQLLQPQLINQQQQQQIQFSPVRVLVNKSPLNARGISILNDSAILEGQLKQYNSLKKTRSTSHNCFQPSSRPAHNNFQMILLDPQQQIQNQVLQFPSPNLSPLFNNQQKQNLVVVQKGQASPNQPKQIPSQKNLQQNYNSPQSVTILSNYSSMTQERSQPQNIPIDMGARKQNNIDLNKGKIISGQNEELRNVITFGNQNTNQNIKQAQENGEQNKKQNQQQNCVEDLKEIYQTTFGKSIEDLQIQKKQNLSVNFVQGELEKIQETLEKSSFNQSFGNSPSNKNNSNENQINQIQINENQFHENLNLQNEITPENQQTLITNKQRQELQNELNELKKEIKKAVEKNNQEKQKEQNKFTQEYFQQNSPLKYQNQNNSFSQSNNSQSNSLSPSYNQIYLKRSKSKKKQNSLSIQQQEEQNTEQKKDSKNQNKLVLDFKQIQRKSRKDFQALKNSVNLRQQQQSSVSIKKLDKQEDSQNNSGINLKKSKALQNQSKSPSQFSPNIQQKSAKSLNKKALNLSRDSNNSLSKSFVQQSSNKSAQLLQETVPKDKIIQIHPSYNPKISPFSVQEKETVQKQQQQQKFLSQQKNEVSPIMLYKEKGCLESPSLQNQNKQFSEKKIVQELDEQKKSASFIIPISQNKVSQQNAFRQSFGIPVQQLQQQQDLQFQNKQNQETQQETNNAQKVKETPSFIKMQSKYKEFQKTNSDQLYKSPSTLKKMENLKFQYYPHGEINQAFPAELSPQSEEVQKRLNFNFQYKDNSAPQSTQKQNRLGFTPPIEQNQQTNFRYGNQEIQQIYQQISTSSQDAAIEILSRALSRNSIPNKETQINNSNNQNQTNLNNPYFMGNFDKSNKSQTSTYQQVLSKYCTSRLKKICGYSNEKTSANKKKIF